MQIVTLEPPSVQGQGDHIYRAREPTVHLAAHSDVYAMCGTWLSPAVRQAAEDADVLVLCQAVDADFLPLMARRRARGLVTVVEINDHFLAAHANQGVAAFYANPINQSLAFQLAALADGLQFSTHALAQVFGHLNAKQAVFTNALTQNQITRGATAPRLNTSHPRVLRLGWGGSHGHRTDLAWLMPAFKSILARHPTLQLCIMSTPELRPLFSWVPAAQLQWRGAGSLEAYHAFLEQLDIGVAPLCATAFNDCRSDVKYLEYTMAGVPAVFSARPAYASCVVHEKTGLLAETVAAFEAQVHRLIDSAPLRERLVLAAQAQVFESRLGPQAAAARLAFWQGLGAGTRPTATHGPRWAQQLPASAQCAPRAWVVALAGAEADLHDGLLLGSAPDATRHLARACTLAPGNYLCWLYLAQAASEAKTIEDALQRALALSPASPSVQYALGLHRLDQGLAPGHELASDDRDAPSGDARDAFAFAPLDELRGRHAVLKGHYQQAEQAFLRALQCNRWYRLPATRLAQMHIHCARPQEAERLLRSNVACSSAHWLDYVLLGELAGARGAWRFAKQQFYAAQRRGAPTDQVSARLAQSYAALGDAGGARRALAAAQTTA